MQHVTLKAQTTEVDTEAGVFTALVSGWTEDREGDTILPTAFDRTVEAWRRAQKRLPLLFEHSVKAVGAIFPESMHTTWEGLVVSGEVDRSTDEGRQVWRMIKNSTCSFSIGFMSESRPRPSGEGREIFEVDLLEISATSTPVHAATRVVSWKSAAATTTWLSEEERQSFERLRAERKAEQASEAAKQEKKTPSYRNWVPARPPDEDRVVPLCGLRVLAKNIRVNGR